MIDVLIKRRNSDMHIGEQPGGYEDGHTQAEGTDTSEYIFAGCSGGSDCLSQGRHFRHRRYSCGTTFCSLSHPACDIFLQQPEKTDTETKSKLYETRRNRMRYGGTEVEALEDQESRPSSKEAGNSVSNQNKTKDHGETREKERKEQVVTSVSPLPSVSGTVTEKREQKTQAREVKQCPLDLSKWLSSELKQLWLLPKACTGLS